jgi:alpha-ribazole phosphatase
MARLLLIRHGQTETDDPTKLWGHTDVPLSAEGARQAGKLRERLSHEKIDAVFSSDLVRARDTAAVIASSHGLEVVPRSELREIDFGDCEGMTFDDAKKRFPGIEKMWFENSPGRGFPNGESLEALARRIDLFIATISEQTAGDATVLLVAHGGSLRVLVCLLAGIGLGAWRKLSITTASLSIVETYSGSGVVSLLNDRCHLETDRGGDHGDRRG